MSTICQRTSARMEYLRELSRRHEALKKRIHSFRIPLSPMGQRIMGLVYFSIPVVGGYYLMQLVAVQAEKNLKDVPLTLSKDQQKTAEDQKAAIAKLLNKYNPNKPSN